MIKPKYCVWDVGKTIYDYSLKPLDTWFRKQTNNLPEYEKKEGIFTFDYDPYMMGKVNFADFCKEMCDTYGVEYSAYSQIMINKKLHEGVGEHYAETRAAMEMLKDRGVENCILSNALPVLSNTSNTEDVIKPKHLFPSYDLGMLKPDVEIFKHVQKSLGCKFEEIIFVDDKPKNVEAAKSLGISGIVFNRDTIVQNLDNMTTITKPQLIKRGGRGSEL